ncbi:MAG: ribbon-helix-helix protein, CopG family, partial [Conexivisphaerales archaeon]
MSSKEYLKQTSFKCEDSLFLKLEEESKKTNTTKAAIVREAVKQLLQHRVDEIRELRMARLGFSMHNSLFNKVNEETSR